MPKKKKDIKQQESQNTILVVLAIIILLFLLIFAQLKAKKKELEDVKNKIRSKEELLAKLTRREKRIFLIIRALFIGSNVWRTLIYASLHPNFGRTPPLMIIIKASKPNKG